MRSFQLIVMNSLASFFFLFDVPIANVFSYGTCSQICFAMNIRAHVTHLMNIWVATV
jgi:hypothetical protein